MKEIRARRVLTDAAVCLIAAALILSVCSMTSFLFPLHDRVDQNVFYTIGREMLEGRVVYRDMPEQKGLYVYLLHELAAAVDPTHMIGMYLIQTVFYAALLYFVLMFFKGEYSVSDGIGKGRGPGPCSGKAQADGKAPAAGLFAASRFSPYMYMLLFGVVCACTQCYLRGDNVEEFILPFFMLTFLMLSTRFCRRHPCLFMLAEGMIVGLAFWIKFSMLGFWLVWFILHFVWLFIQKRPALVFRDLGMFLAGFGALTLPVIVYCAVKGCLYDMFYWYFYANIVLYSRGSSFFYKLGQLCLSVFKNLGQNPVYFILIHLGLADMIREMARALRRRKDVRGFGRRLMAEVRESESFRLQTVLVLGYAGLFLGMYGGGVWYDYYYLIAAPYVLFGICSLRDCLLRPVVRVREFFAGHAVAAVCVLALCTVVFGNCIKYYGKSRDDYVQTQFGAVMKEAGADSMLNYGFIDQGFYLASGTRPVNKFFFTLNISEEKLPEMYAEQRELVAARAVDYIVIRVKKSQTISDYKEAWVLDYYEVCAEGVSIGDNYRFYLLKAG